jgi:hypothetical protein
MPGAVTVVIGLYDVATMRESVQQCRILAGRNT